MVTCEQKSQVAHLYLFDTLKEAAKVTALGWPPPKPRINRWERGVALLARSMRRAGHRHQGLDRITGVLRHFGVSPAAHPPTPGEMRGVAGGRGPARYWVTLHKSCQVTWNRSATLRMPVDAPMAHISALLAQTVRVRNRCIYVIHVLSCYTLLERCVPFRCQA